MAFLRFSEREMMKQSRLTEMIPHFTWGMFVIVMGENTPFYYLYGVMVYFLHVHKHIYLCISIARRSFVVNCLLQIVRVCDCHNINEIKEIEEKLLKKFMKAGKVGGSNTGGCRDLYEAHDFLEKTKFAVDVFCRVCYI